MLAADTDTQARINAPAFLNRTLDKLANARLVNGLEGINIKHLFLKVGRQERADIITAEP